MAEAGAERTKYKWYVPLVGLGKGLLELLVHAIGLVALLGLIRLIEKVVEWLWETQDLVFFGSFQVKYVFQGAELCMLVGFLILGTFKFLRAVYEK